MAGNIGVDALLKFTDRDYHRLVYGERLQQTTFLKHCDNLKVLELAVHEPGTFSWALERNLDGNAQRHRGNYLCILERLYIHMDAGLVVVHDAITAFGQSLRYLKVSGNTIPQELSLLKDMQVSEWIIPFLRTLIVDIEATVRVVLGGFDQCPCLETLSLRIRSITNPLVQRFTYPVSSTPIWKLPRLTSLKLYRRAALSFDFDSLEHMPTLERLVMVSAGDERPIPDEYLPRLMAYQSFKQSSNCNNGASSLGAGKWRNYWILPHLKSIHLEGPPSWVFCFQWLITCLSLESIHLTTGKDFQQLPLSSSSENASRMPTKTPTKRQPGTNPENVEDSGFE